MTSAPRHRPTFASTAATGRRALCRSRRLDPSSRAAADELKRRARGLSPRTVGGIGPASPRRRPRQEFLFQLVDITLGVQASSPCTASSEPPVIIRATRRSTRFGPISVPTAAMWSWSRSRRRGLRPSPRSVQRLLDVGGDVTRRRRRSPCGQGGGDHRDRGAADEPTRRLHSRWRPPAASRSPRTPGGATGLGHDDDRRSGSMACFDVADESFVVTNIGNRLPCSETSVSTKGYRSRVAPIEDGFMTVPVAWLPPSNPPPANV